MDDYENELDPIEIENGWIDYYVEMQKEEKALREYESHKSEGEISDWFYYWINFRRIYWNNAYFNSNRRKGKGKKERIKENELHWTIYERQRH